MTDRESTHILVALGLAGLVVSLSPAILLFVHANRILSLLDGHAFKAIILLSFGGAILTSISVGMAIKDKTIAVAAVPFVAIGIGVLAIITNVFAGFAY